MCYVAAIPLIAAAVSAGAQVYSSNQQRKAAEAAAQSSQAAQTPPVPTEQQAKAPDQTQSAAALGIGTGTNNLGAANFQSNTLLTGAQGVQDPLSLSARRLYGGATPTSDLLGG